MKNLVFLTTSSIIGKLASFVLYSLLAYNFGKESLGYFSYYFIVANIFYLLFDFGGNIYEVKFFTSETYEKNVADVFFVKIFTYSIFAPFIFLFISDPFFIILYVSFFLESLFTVVKSGLFCKKQFLTFSYYMIIEKVSLIIIALTGTFAIKSLFIFYFALLISKIIVLYIIFLRKPAKKNILNISNLSLKRMHTFVSDSWSYTFYSFFALVYGRVGVVIMKHLSENSMGDIGIYSSYENIIMSTLIIPEIFFKSYYPAITEDYVKKDISSMYEKITSVLKISLISSFLIALFVAIFSKEVSRILFGPDFVESKILLSIFSIKIVFRFALRPYLPIVASSDFTGFRTSISFVIFLFSIGINLTLIPFFGLQGLVGAALLVELILFLSYRIFCQLRIIKRTFLKHDIALLTQIALILLVTLFLNDIDIYLRMLAFTPIVVLTLFMLLKEKNNFIFRKE